MKGELENNPDKFQNTITTITQVFQEAMTSDNGLGEQLPPELKNVFNTVIKASPLNNPDAEFNNDEIMNSLESIIESNGLNKDDFMSSIKGSGGEIDFSKLENILNNLK